MEKKYYNLYHEYESSEGVDVSKFIGIFESKEIANKVIYKLKNKKGFKEYSKECFEISECWVDSYYGWRTGFISTEEIQNELNDKKNDIL